MLDFRCPRNLRRLLEALDPNLVSLSQKRYKISIKASLFHPWNNPNYQILAILAIIHFRILIWYIYLVEIHSRSPNWLWNSWCNNIILKRWPLTDKAKLLKFAGFWNMDNFYGRRWKFLFWLISDPLYYRGSKNTNLTSVQFRKGKAVAPATCVKEKYQSHIFQFWEADIWYEL